MSTPALQTMLAGLALAVWIYLMLGRGGFWRAQRQLDRGTLEGAPAAGLHWPAVVAVVPARNEVDMLPQSLASLLAQDYPGPFHVVLVDDHSDDGTARAALELGARHPGRLSVLPAAALAPGWTGKLWAVSQGVASVESSASPPEFLLLTDADIGYEPDALTSLVRRAEAGGCALVSLMARLRCASLAERALVPAFIFFFQMLYPFAWVNRSDRPCRVAFVLIDAEKL